LLKLLLSLIWQSHEQDRTVSLFVDCVVHRLKDPVENTIRNLETLSEHLEAVAMAKAQEIMVQRQKIEAILHSILPK